MKFTAVDSAVGIDPDKSIAARLCELDKIVWIRRAVHEAGKQAGDIQCIAGHADGEVGYGVHAVFKILEPERVVAAAAAKLVFAALTKDYVVAGATGKCVVADRGDTALVILVSP